MLFSFVKGSPALIIKKEGILVAGDLHIGKEFRLEKSGLHFADATRKMALELLDIYRKTHARRLVLLGDIKDTIGYPPREEFEALASFFNEFRHIKVTVVKGNHDAHLAELLGRIGMAAPVVRELLLRDIAMIHGNALPSSLAMTKKYIIAGHSHIAVNAGGAVAKGWLLACPGKETEERYAGYNKSIKLLVMPAFSSLITGVTVGIDSDGMSMPLMRNRIFDLSTARIYDLDGKLVK
ncbi:MAG: metallophosphoesterase family protein [Candidatus Micrarchaeaceae archaeon]